MRKFALAIAAIAVALGAASVAAPQTVPSTREEIARGFASVLRDAAPGVVNIYTRRVVPGRSSPFSGDPFFEQFFGGFGATGPQVQSSLGSGVIVTSDGLVVSNYHVVGLATDITVVLNDRREFAAEVVLADEPSDLAVLRIRSDDPLPTLTLRDSDTVEVGDLVLAIGNPFGLGQTVSMGIVSGLARSALSVGDGRGYFMQTDAAINPGNSGGALVDVRGALVGINTAILTRSGGSQGIGFVIPANLVRALVAQAQQGATRFQRPWAGVTGQAVDAALAEALGLARPQGVVLAEISPQSPFAEAGLQAGDVIIQLGDSPVNTPQEMLFRLSSRGLGGVIGLRYIRDATERSAQVALIAAPDVPPRDSRRLETGSVFDGLLVARLNPAVQEELSLPDPGLPGVVVMDAEGISARTGLQRADIVVAINGEPVSSPAEFEAASTQDVTTWTIDLIRDQRMVRLRFRL